MTWKNSNRRDVGIMRLATAVAAYLAAKRSENLRPATLVNYERALSRFAARIGIEEIEDIGVVEVRRYLVELFEAGYRDTSVRLFRTILVQLLDWSALEGYCDLDGWGRRLGCLRVNETAPRWLTAEEARRLLVAAAKLGSKSVLVRKRNPALVAMMLDTGARKGELVNVRLDDLRLEIRSVRISSECKSRRERVLPFSAETLRLLRGYLRERERGFPDCPWLWVSREGRHLSRNQVYDLVKEAAKIAGLHGVYPHALRHTCGTLLLANGMDSIHVQAILGHARAETTRRYVHLMGEDIRKAFASVAVVDRLLREG